MKNKNPSRRPLLNKSVHPTITAFLLSLPLTPVVMADNSVTDNEVELDSINVLGEKTNQFNTEYSSSNKFTAPLLDTPKTVNVIPKAVISEKGVTTLEEALRTVPGITFGAGEGGNPLGDRPFIRGIDSQNSISVDGLRDIAAGSREMFNVEQVEVIKGADSAFNGRAGAGGSINISTKLPKAENFKRAEVGLGTDNHFRSTIDVNQFFDNSVAVRLNAMGLKEDIPGRDGPENKRWGIAPSVTLGLNTPTRATLAWYHLETNDIPDGGVPYNIPSTLPTSGAVTLHPTTGGDRKNWYGMTHRDFRDETTDQLTGIVEHDLNSDTTIKNTFRFAKSKQDYLWTLPDDSKGNVAKGLVWRRGNANYSKTETVQNATELSGKFDTSFIEHSYTTGIELSHEKSEVKRTAVTFNNAYVNCGQDAIDTFLCTSLSNPSPNDPWLFGYTLPEPAKYRTKTASAYVFDTMELSPQWLLNGGVRFDHYDSSYTGASAASVSRIDNLWNYQLGIVFKPVENGSIYANYSTSSTPGNSFLGQGREAGSIDPNGRRSPSNADQLKPEKTRAYELGTKWNFADDRLSLGAAVFRNEVTNVRIQDPNDASLAEMGGEKVVNGLELSATGQLTRKWDVFAGYTYMDSEQKDLGLSGGVPAAGTGKAFPNTPRHSFTLWTSYKVTPKLTSGVGMISQSEMVGGYTFNDDALITRAVPGYTRFDGMVNYAISDKLEAQLNVYNLLDKEYYSSSYTSHYATMAAGRSAVATLKLDF